jgi:hypothetical protein
MSSSISSTCLGCVLHTLNYVKSVAYSEAVEGCSIDHPHPCLHQAAKDTISSVPPYIPLHLSSYSVHSKVGRSNLKCFGLADIVLNVMQ